MSFYPAPNNHVLHSVLTTFFYNPGPYQTYLLRLPAFIFGLAALWLFYKITKKHFGSTLGLIGLMVMGAIQPVLHYGFQARGYSMILFFSLAAVYFWIKRGDFPQRKEAVLYVLCLALGIYTIPSHLYFLLAFSVGVGLLHIGRRSFVAVLVRLVIYNFLGVLGAVLLYLPVIRGQGIDALIANQYVKAKDSLSLSQWFGHFKEVGEAYLISEISLLAIMLLALWILFRKRKFSNLGVVSAGVCLTILIIPVLHQTFPFTRVWIFVTPFFLWVLAESSRIARNKIPPGFAVIKKAVFIAAFFLMICWEWSSMKKSMAMEEASGHYKNLATEIINRQYHKVYVQDFYAYAFFPYYFSNAESGEQIQLTVDGRTTLSREEWRQNCGAFEIMVFDTSFRTDSLAGECMIDTSGYNLLVNTESCSCISKNAF